MKQGLIAPRQKGRAAIELDDVASDMVMLSHPELIETKSSFTSFIADAEMAQQVRDEDSIVVKPVGVVVEAHRRIEEVPSDSRQERNGCHDFLFVSIISFRL